MTASDSNPAGRDLRSIAIRLEVDPKLLLESVRRHPSTHGSTITAASDEPAAERRL